MSQRIFLTCTNATAIPYVGSSMGHHIAIHYIDSDGNHRTLQGIPENRFDHNLGKFGAFVREEGWSNGASNQDSPFGRLEARRGLGSEDSFGEPQTVIAEGKDLRDLQSRLSQQQPSGTHSSQTGRT